VGVQGVSSGFTGVVHGALDEVLQILVLHRRKSSSVGGWSLPARRGIGLDLSTGTASSRVTVR
jgi:hypothetical protein